MPQLDVVGIDMNGMIVPAVILSPLIVPSVLFIFVLFRSTEMSSLWFPIFMIPYCYAGTIFFGIPVYLILDKLKIAKYYTIGPTGLIGGILFLWFLTHEFSSSIWVNSIFGGFGAVTGLVFHSIYKRGKMKIMPIE